MDNSRTLFLNAFISGLRGEAPLPDEKPRHHLIESDSAKIKGLFGNVKDLDSFLSGIEKEIHFIIGFQSHLKDKAIRPWQRRGIKPTARYILTKNLGKLFEQHTKRQPSYTFNYHSSVPERGAFVDLLEIAFREAKMPCSRANILKHIKKYRFIRRHLDDI